MEAQHELLEIKDLTIQYVTDDEVVHAVNNISLTIPKGKTLGLVGETGAGKTTTALSILRLLPKFTAKIPSGEIWFNGENLLEKTEAQMRKIRGGRISMIFQDPMTSLNPVLTVGDQIAEVLKMHRPDLRGKELEQEIGRLLEMVGIPAFRMTDYPHQFSGGMKQRVVIAIAIACSPELLIADEPTTALDVTIQAQVLNMMRKLRRELDSSMLMITHDLGVVANICDYVAIMYAGEIVEYGTVEDIFTPGLKHHPYTEGLFRSIPNIQVESRRLQPIDGLMPEPTNLPAGCKFNPRCPHCTEQCKAPVQLTVTDKDGKEQTVEESAPVWREGSRYIKCHLFAKEAEQA